jgi:isocitrate dehydrogenase kinase/phosphatase
VEFWQSVQTQLREGHLFDFYPYPQSRRFERVEGRNADARG